MVYKESFLEKGITLALMAFLFIWIAGNLLWFTAITYWQAIAYGIALLLVGLFTITFVISMIAFMGYIAYRIIKDKEQTKSIYQ